MQIRKFSYWVATVALGVVGLSSAHAGTPRSARSFLVAGATIEPPRGFVMMCERIGDPLLCARQGAQGAEASGAGNAALETGGIVMRTPGPSMVRNERLDAGFPVMFAPLPAFSLTATVKPAPAALFRGIPLAERMPVFAPLAAIEPLAAALPEPVVTKSPDDAGSAPRVAAGADAMALLKKVNKAVNGRVRQDTDFAIYGRDEYWQRSGRGPGAAGDCEDIAIEKRIELTEAGFPEDRLAFAIVYSQAAGLHTVLVARLDHGDVILDNRTIAIRRWADSEYSFIGIQDFQDPMHWLSVNRRDG